MRPSLYELLPAVHRDRDAAAGFPLRALLEVVEDQARLLEGDVRRFYDDLFIETCDLWVVPYIGDLVGNDPLFDAARHQDDRTARATFTDLTGPDLRPPVGSTVRADVAKTISYRRRKGTPPMLEELARDVTGLPAHVVEFFERIGWHQDMEHIRPWAGWTDVRSPERMDRIEGAFDDVAHTVDVRAAAPAEGRYNVPEIGFFLWRLRSFALEQVPARQSAGRPWAWHFSPLGNPAPLFSRWRREGDEAGMATELHVPAPIRPARFSADLDAYREDWQPGQVRPAFTELYGLFDLDPAAPGAGANPEAAFTVWVGSTPVLPAADPAAPPSTFTPQVVCRRLDPWPAVRPADGAVYVDVERGRLVVGQLLDPAAAQPVSVSYHYGFPAALGGGPYERRSWLIRRGIGRRMTVRAGSPFPPADPDGPYGTLQQALNARTPATGTVIRILDNAAYTLPDIQLAADEFLAIEAANRTRPVLRGALQAGNPVPVDVTVAGAPPAGSRAALTLSGVVVEGALRVSGDAGLVRLLHATVVPGAGLTEAGAPLSPALPAVEVTLNPAGRCATRVQLGFAVCGPMRIPDRADGVLVVDSIVDGIDGGMAIGGPAGASGPDLQIERSTVLGPAAVRSIEASECVFTGDLTVARTQAGCVRFSYTTPASRTPRRYLCQPDRAVADALREALRATPTLTAAQRAAIADEVRRRVVPVFTDRRYGRPAYAQLWLGGPVEIATGAEDGSEMGAYCHLKQPQREGNLRLRLREYLPLGLNPTVVYVT